MDPFSPLTTSSLNIHSLEIFTGSMIFQGNSTGPFRRSSDLINRKDREYLVLQDARMAPPGRQPGPVPLTTPLTIARKHIHLVAVAPQPEAEYTSGSLSSGALSSGSLNTSGLGAAELPRARNEYIVRKTATPCYVLTPAYVVSGMCHLIEGSSVENLLDISDFFLALTGTTIHMLMGSVAPWQRDLLLVHKEHIQAMYLLPLSTTTQPLQQGPGAGTSSTSPL